MSSSKSAPQPSAESSDSTPGSESGSESDSMTSGDSGLNWRYDMENTHFFGAKLTADRREYVWGNDETESDEADDSNAMQEILKLRQVTLGIGAKPGERNTLDLVSMTKKGVPMHYTVATLTAGKTEMAVIDFDFMSTFPVLLKLSAGSGPLHVIGSVEEQLNYDANGSFGKEMYAHEIVH